MNTEPKIYSFDSSLLPDANPKDGFCVDLVRVGDYASLKTERDALAVENAALKSKAAELVNEASEVYSAYNATIKEPDGDFMDMQTLYEMQCIETPATSAALAAIQAQGVEAAAAKLYGSGYVFEVLMRHAAELREAK